MDWRIETRVNGEVVQHGSTTQMIYGVGETLALISQNFTINPGDLLATGTPSGVGYARTPRWLLEPGDVVEVEIERLGILTNHIVGNEKRHEAVPPTPDAASAPNPQPQEPHATTGNTRNHHEQRRRRLRPRHSTRRSTDPSLFIKFEPGTRVLPAGFQTTPQFKPLPVDIVFDKDLAVTLRDGTTIYVDVLRPAGTEKVPVIIAWSPYGKSGGTHPRNWDLFALLGIDQSELSGLGKFEGPDPAFWCANGFAICNPDARGAFNSEGDIYASGREEGKDGADLVEWLAEQDWCNGKVGICRQLLPGPVAVVHRCRAAGPPRRDRAVGRLERHLPRPRPARRDARPVIPRNVDVLVRRHTATAKTSPRRPDRIRC